MSVKDTRDHGPHHDSPAGDSAEGAPRLETGGGPVDRDNEVWVNQTFIDVHGEEAARTLAGILETVSAQVGTKDRQAGRAVLPGDHERGSRDNPAHRGGVDAARGPEGTRGEPAPGQVDGPQVREELKRRFAEAGLNIAPVEIDRYADRIVRSVDTKVEVNDLHVGQRHHDALVDGDTEPN